MNQVLAMSNQKKTLPQVTIDHDLSVGYIRFTYNKVERQLILDEEDTLIVDYDAEGDVVGIEIVSLLRLERLARNAISIQRTKKQAREAALKRTFFNESNLPLYVLPQVANHMRACH